MNLSDGFAQEVIYGSHCICRWYKCSQQANLPFYWSKKAKVQLPRIVWILCTFYKSVLLGWLWLRNTHTLVNYWLVQRKGMGKNLLQMPSPFKVNKCLKRVAPCTPVSTTKDKIYKINVCVLVNCKPSFQKFHPIIPPNLQKEMWSDSISHSLFVLHLLTLTRWRRPCLRLSSWLQ